MTANLSLLAVALTAALLTGAPAFAQDTVNEKKGVKRSTMQHIEFASTRHMAWEVLLALEEQMVHLFPPIPEYKPPQRENEQ